MVNEFVWFFKGREGTWNPMPCSSFSGGISGSPSIEGQHMSRVGGPVVGESSYSSHLPQA